MTFTHPENEKARDRHTDEIRHAGAPRIIAPDLDEYRTGQGGARCPTCGVFVSHANEQSMATCEACWVSPHHG